MSTWVMMHGYAGYIWTAYTLVLGVFVIHAVYARARLKSVQRMLSKWLSEQ